MQQAGLIWIVHNWGTWVLRSIVGSAAIYVTFACLKNKAALNKISDQVAQSPIRWNLFWRSLRRAESLRGVCTLWAFRRSYSNLNWRCDWLSPVIGAVVFVIWVGLDRFQTLPLIVKFQHFF
jgi:hypothetical protein